MLSKDLNKRIQIIAKMPIENEIGETEYKDAVVKTVFAKIVPQTGTLIKQSNVDLLLAGTTHKILIRYKAFPDLKTSMRLRYKNHVYDIKYILNPYEKDETLEIFAEEKLYYEEI